MRETILGEEYVTVAEAARLLQVHPSSIRRWIEEGNSASAWGNGAC